MANLSYLLLILSLILPPVLTPVWGFSYENIKVLSFIILVSLALICWAFSGNRKAGIKHQPFSIEGIATAFILWLLLTSILGVNIPNSLFGSQPYFQGWFLYLFLWVFSLMISIIRPDLTLSIVCLSLSSIIVSLIALKDWVSITFLGGDVPTYAGRVVSTFGQPNFYAGFILMTVTLGIVLAQHRSKGVNIIGLANLILGSLAIAISGSKLTSGLLLALLVGWWLIRVPRVLAIFSAFFSGCIVTLFLIWNIYSGGWIYQEIIQPFNELGLVEGTAEKRLYIWVVTYQLMRQNLLKGIGMDNLAQGYQEYFQSLNFNTLNIPSYHELRDLIVDRAHNYLLDVAIATGVVGSLLWLTLVALTVWRLRTSPLVIGLLIYLIWIQFHNQSVVHLIYFWWILGRAVQDTLDKGGVIVKD